MQITGGCLCGDVRYEAKGDPAFQANCYCTDCRKLGGGHASWMAIAQSDISIAGSPEWFDSTSDRGTAVGRAFCRRCGVGLFGRNAGMAGMIFVRPSTLDDPAHFTPQMSIYASRAPHWDRPAADVPAFPEMPPMPEMAP